MNIVESKSSLSLHVDAIKERGYTVVPGVLSAEQIASAKANLLELFETEKNRGSKENNTSQYQSSLCLPAKKKIFRDICLIPAVLELAQILLGDDCVVSGMNGFTTRPHGDKQRLHVDMPKRRPLMTAVQMVLCLDDFTRQNGCTRIVPYSQNELNDQLCFDSVEDQTVEIEAPAGSLIAFDSYIIHSAGANKTDNLRLSLHIAYTRRWVQPQWDFNYSMTKGVRDRLTAEERAIFGIDSHPYVYDSYTCRPVDPTKLGRLRYYARRLRAKLFSGL